MDDRERAFFHELLLTRRAELLNEAGRTVTGMSGNEKENFPDPTDRATLEASRNFLLRIRDRERKLVTKIDEALDRLAKGEYGICEECDEPIGVERLKARPVTTLCIDCKAAQEADEKNLRTG